MSKDPRKQVFIADYDPAWPRSFQQIAQQLRGLCGPLLQSVEHVGSTSVPDLAAKPIIDAMPGVRSLEDADACVPLLVAAGYRYIAKHEDVFPQRRLLALDTAPVCHLHMVVIGSSFWNEHLAFRDALRADPETKRRYAELKRRLALRFSHDRGSYTDAKGAFIRGVVERSRKP